MRLDIFFEKTLSKMLRPLIRGAYSKTRISASFFEKLVESINLEAGCEVAKFVKSDDLLVTCRNYAGSSALKIIVAGKSDLDIRDFPESEIPAGVTIFAQNLCSKETHNLKLLPIGVEDLSYGRNALPWNFSKRLTNRHKARRILVGPFGKTHPVRAELVNQTFSSGGIEVRNERIANWNYSKLASGFLFVACPRGNGLDTHRFWETLYRNSAPVVIGSDWSNTLRTYGVPMVELQDWGQMSETRIWESESGWPLHPIQYLEPSWWSNRFFDLVGL